MVLDSSALIPFIRIGKLDLFKDTWANACIPQGVYDEIMQSPRSTGPFLNACRQWIAVKKMDQKKVGQLAEYNGLTPVDAEVLQLCLDENATMVSGDRALMQAAIACSVPVLWTADVLMVAIGKKVLTPRQGLETLDELLSAGFHMRAEVYAALRNAIERLEIDSRNK